MSPQTNAAEPPQPLYEYTVLGKSFRVWPNRIEDENTVKVLFFKDTKKTTILLRNIASVDVEARRNMMKVPKLRITTNEGELYEFVLPDPEKAHDAMVGAM
jgi:hypothetical protein